MGCEKTAKQPNSQTAILFSFKNKQYNYVCNKQNLKHSFNFTEKYLFQQTRLCKGKLNFKQKNHFIEFVPDNMRENVSLISLICVFKVGVCVCVCVCVCV